MIYYKKDVLQALKEVGYSTYRLQKEKLLSAGTVQKIREDDTSIQIETLNIICGMLQCQPGDILEWVPDEEEDPQ
ncbi:MAG: helix-turn-helix transcriptional regulator [Oscillospiraceae bacterium]|nr:helix-turn-helix transcriptional regulator [Oscillospiraceae bacterium]